MRKSRCRTPASAGPAARSKLSDQIRERRSERTAFFIACARRSLAAGDRVDVLNLAGQGHGLPGLAGVLGAENFAIIAGADINLRGVARMKPDRHDGAVDLDLVEALPALSAIAAAIEPA